MPQTVTCSQCGTILHKGLELKPADEIMQQIGGLCPKCGRKLSFNPGNVEISPQP